jgi:hypothetical protein
MHTEKRPAGSLSNDFQGFQTASTRTGTIVEWADDKGCGWVKSGEKRYFAHIKDFRGSIVILFQIASANVILGHRLSRALFELIKQ